MTTMHFTTFADLRFGQWEPLWLDYAGDRRAELSTELNQRTFTRLQSGEGGLQGLAAWQHELVGFAHFFLHPSSWSTTQECYLQDLYIARTERGTGLGKALLLEVAQKAREQGCSALHWRTRTTNLGAQALYDKLARRLDYVEYQIDLAPAA
jgi:GNAT superfamily N-acetyltransferase